MCKWYNSTTYTFCFWWDEYKGEECNNMGKKNRKLRVSRLKLKLMEYIVLSGVSISVLLLMMVFATYMRTAKVNQQALVLEMMGQNASNQREQFENYIEEKIEILRALSSYPDIYEMNEADQEKFIKGHSMALGFNHIFIMNKNGIGYYIDEGVYRDQRQEEFFTQVMNVDELKTDPFYIEDDTPIMTVSVPIRNNKGEKEGALCGAISLTKIQKLIHNNEMILDGKCFILDKNGIYITSENEADVKNKVSVFDTLDSELSLLNDAIIEKTDKCGTVILNGIEYEAYASYIKDYNWLVVQIIAVEQITALYSSLSIIQNVLAICIVLLVFFIVRIIVRWNNSNNKIYTDTLTKCNSRAACLEMIETLEDYTRQSVTVVYMDLNRFKFVNDTFGHDKGDELLCVFTKALEQTIGKLGFVGRMGGDEFIAIFLDTTEEQLLEQWKKLELCLKEQSKQLDFEYEIESSFGYATREKGSTKSLDVIMQQADERMYEYKTRMKAQRQS